MLSFPGFSCLVCLIHIFKYQFAALIRMKHFQTEYEEARRKDAQYLESKITLYARHHQEMLQELEIQQREMKDALLAMQRVSLLTAYYNGLLVINKSHP